MSALLSALKLPNKLTDQVIKNKILKELANRKLKKIIVGCS